MNVSDVLGGFEMSNFRRAGRPLTFSPTQRAEFAEMIREHGARGTCERSAVPISLQTVLKIAREFQIPLPKGRRPRPAA
jgi:hypothetical protein